MITDELTDTVYTSTLLKQRFPELHRSISAILKKERVHLIEIDYTKDIWCRDYMPVQVLEVNRIYKLMFQFGFNKSSIIIISHVIQPLSDKKLQGIKIFYFIQ